MSEKELRGCVHCESGQDVLNIDRDAVFETFLHLRDDMVYVTVEEFKIADPVLAEERSGHGSVEPTRDVNKRNVYHFILSAHFHRSPAQCED